MKNPFDDVADRYAKARPTYPEALFDRIATICSLDTDDPVLEIGPGTGQATIPLAQRGYQITAIEQGPRLAAAAREQVRPYAKVRVKTGRFEDVPLPEAAYKLVVAATAFHWIDAAHRFTKPHRLLSAGGHLAIIHTHHVSDGKGDHFTQASQSSYRRFWPPAPGAEFRLPRIDELRPQALDESRFRQIYFGTFPCILPYTSASYVDLLHTFSPTLGLDPKACNEFLQSIGRLIREEFNDYIEKQVAMTLTIAARENDSLGTPAKASGQ